MQCTVPLNEKWRGAASGYNHIFIGWFDIDEEEWATFGYAPKEDFVNVIAALNKQIQKKYIRCWWLL